MSSKFGSCLELDVDLWQFTTSPHDRQQDASVLRCFSTECPKTLLGEAGSCGMVSHFSTARIDTENLPLVGKE